MLADLADGAAGGTDAAPQNSVPSANATPLSVMRHGVSLVTPIAALLSGGQAGVVKDIAQV